MNNSDLKKIHFDKSTLFLKIKETQKLPDEIVTKFLLSKGKLKNKIFHNTSLNEKQS